MGRTKTKHTIYLPPEMIAELREEAKRLDRSVTWIVERAWVLARKRLESFPAPPGLGEQWERNNGPE